MDNRFWGDPDDVLFPPSRQRVVTYLPASWSVGVVEPQPYAGALEPQQQPHLLAVSGRAAGTGSGVAITNRNIRGRWPECVALAWQVWRRD